MSVKRTCTRLVQWSKNQRKLLMGVVIGAAVGGSAIAFASIPDGSGVIHGCYRASGNLINPKGSLRVIDTDAGQACTAQENAITWNQTGPQGPQGPQGSAGSGGFVSNLAGADFSGASLQYREFAGLDLSNARFSSANIHGADFSGANLSGVAFGGGAGAGNNANVNFSGANITGGNFTTTSPTFTANDNFQNANLTNGSLTSSLITSQNPNSYMFINDDFRGVNLTNTNIQAHFQSVNFSGVDFRAAAIVQDNGNDFTGFNQSNLSSTDFANLLLDHVTFLSSNMANADFSGVQFQGGSLLGSDFSSVNLSNTTWTAVTCPDNTNSDDNGNTCIGHLTP